MVPNYLTFEPAFLPDLNALLVEKYYSIKETSLREPLQETDAFHIVGVYQDVGIEANLSLNVGDAQFIAGDFKALCVGQIDFTKLIIRHLKEYNGVLTYPPFHSPKMASTYADFTAHYTALKGAFVGHHPV